MKTVHDYPAAEWLEWLKEKLGTSKWVVAHRLTQRLKDRGYEKALSQKRYKELGEEFVKSKNKSVDEIIEEFSNKMLECFRHVGEKKNSMRVRSTHYTQKMSQFVGVQICPSDNIGGFAFDIVKAQKVFTEINDFSVSNYMLAAKGEAIIPHLRIMGQYDSLTFMVDVHLQVADLDSL